MNMGSPLTLENFIGEGMRMFPAPRTALVLWNHGGGWTSLLHDENAPGTETGSGHMTLEDVRVALSRAAVNYPDGKLDLLVLDMCLMGQAETLVAVNPFVKYLVASPPLAPGLGLDYAGGIPLFAAGLETADIAVGLVKTACKAYIEAEWLDASLAAYDLSKVGGLLSSFGALARKFDTLVPVAWSHLTRSIFYTRSFGGRTDLLQRSGTGTASSIDITDWLNRLEKLADPMLAREFSAEIEAVRKAIADIVIHCESGPLLPDSYGLAVYAPLREANYNNDYSGNAFGAYTDWSQALTDLYVEQRDNAGSPPRIFSIEFGQLAEPEADGGSLDIEPSSWFCFENDQNPHVKLTVDGINIMWVNAGFAVSETDDPYGRYLPLLRQTVLNSHIAVQTEAAKTVASADDELPVFRDGRNVFVYQMASHVTGISNGEEMTLVYPQFLDASEIDKAEIIGQLRRAGSQDYYFAIINTNGDEIVSVHVAVEDEVGNQYISAIMPAPADSFRPILKIIDEDGDESFEPGQEILWGDGPSLVRTLPPKGRYLKIMCMAESLAGEGSTALSEPIHITDPDGPAIAELDGDECDDEYYDEDDEEFADIGEFDEEEDGEYDDDNEYDDEGENE
ncbi:MAG: clostripain-related cysteine peptidase [Planctomycetes bacterium]|nr:clostripain-related cysteine peptidase [Planctomycetota bacterium]